MTLWQMITWRADPSRLEWWMLVLVVVVLVAVAIGGILENRRS